MFDKEVSEGRTAGGVTDAVRVIEVALAELASVDPAGIAGEDLMRSAEALEDLRRRLDAISARTLANLDDRQESERHSGLRTKAWKANRCHLPHAVVARELRAGTVLRDFDEVAHALGVARISIDHVTAIANVSNPRIQPALIEVQDQIVKYASRHRFTHFKAWLAALAELLDSDGAEPDHHDHNTAAMAADSDGNLHLVLELSGVDGVVAQRIINDETDRQFRCAQSESEVTGEPMPSAQQLRARAVLELLRRGADPRPDAPTAVTEAIIAIPVDPLGRPTQVRSSDGTNLSTIDAAVLACDALLQPVGVDSAGTPLNVGRRRRLFTANQRTALAVRDGGCVFPGCDQPVARCDAHHQVPWEHGGRSDIDNGVLLCRRHHRLEHSGADWKLHTIALSALPATVAQAHQQRATEAGLRCSSTVRIWSGPSGQTLLAQTASDHRGPPPPSSSIRDG